MDQTTAPPEESNAVRFDLSEAEQKEAERRSTPRAVVVHEAIRKEGEEELRRPMSALAWSGLAAGLSMGFSLMAEGLLRAALPDAPWRPLVSKLGYSVGFLVVVLGRQQLFTENTLTVILPLLTRRTMAALWTVARLWAVVLAANLVGALLFAWVAGRTDIFDPQVRSAFAALGRDGLTSTFGTVILKGIFAGWLIALMVWLLPGAEAARFWVIILVTYLVGLAKLTHIIAGSVEVLFLVTTGQVSFLTYLARYMVPTLIGNTIGGVSLVAALNHAQVVAGNRE